MTKLMDCVSIIGGKGLVGSCLVEKAKKAFYSVNATHRSKEIKPYDGVFWHGMDLELLSDLRIPSKPQVLFLVAAMAKVVDCEAYPQTSWRVNADAPAQLSLMAAAEGVKVIFISSDAVERAPGLNYSRQKAYAEQIVLSTFGGCVVRPARITPDRVSDFCDMLIELSRGKNGGLVRWP